MERKKEKNVGIIIFRLISIIIIIICLIYLFLWQKDNLANKNLQDDLSSFISIGNSKDSKNKKKKNNNSNRTDELTLDDIEDSDTTNSEDINSTTNAIDVDFDSLLEKNSETVAWIKIDNTNINYPIVQSRDNNYYLTRNFYKEKNSAGWIFADSRNNFETLDKNTIIYGHNRRNGTMFSNLNYFLKSNWYKNDNNKTFNFITQNQTYLAQIFSVYKLSANTVRLKNNFSSPEEIQENINAWKSISVHDFNVNVTPEDNLLTLYTCDDNNSYRIIIVSKLIPLQ